MLTPRSLLRNSNKRKRKRGGSKTRSKTRSLCDSSKYTRNGSEKMRSWCEMKRDSSKRDSS